MKYLILGQFYRRFSLDRLTVCFLCGVVKAWFRAHLKFSSSGNPVSENIISRINWWFRLIVAIKMSLRWASIFFRTRLSALHQAPEKASDYFLLRNGYSSNVSFGLLDFDGCSFGTHQSARLENGGTIFSPSSVEEHEILASWKTQNKKRCTWYFHSLKSWQIMLTLH